MTVCGDKGNKLHRNLQSIMLFKIVLQKQIRVFDCKEEASLAAIHLFIRKSFPALKHYSLYYLDEDEDHISLETDADLNIYLSENHKKPKIFIQDSQADAFDTTVKIELDKPQPEKVQEKQSEDEKVEKSVHLDEKEGCKTEPQLQKQKTEAQKVEEKEGEGEEHPAVCDECGVDPIKGIRFKCAVCEDYDLCEQCESAKGHAHSLIKIRLPLQAPLSCEVKAVDDPIEVERKREIAERINNSVIGKKEKLVYQSFIEREQIIISYLGNLMGEEGFSKHKEFSKECKADTYEDLIEEYLQWQEGRKAGVDRVFDWIKKQFQAIANFKHAHFD